MMLGKSYGPTLPLNFATLPSTVRVIGSCSCSVKFITALMIFVAQPIARTAR